MTRGRSLAIIGGLNFTNAVLMGVALATSRPALHLAMTVTAATFVNLAYVMAGRLWQERR